MNREKNIIYGKHPVLEAAEQGRGIDKIFLQQGIRGELEKQVRKLCKENGIPLQVVPRARLNKLTQGNHQGLVALGSAIEYRDLEELWSELTSRSIDPLLLMLDGITDVRNFGAIARTAECMGVDALLVSAKQSAPANADAIKASAGALNLIPVCRTLSMVNSMEWLQSQGVRVAVSSLKASKTLSQCDFKGPLALVVGSEGAGVHPSLIDRADELFIIPQAGKTDSLNVSVASGIILYEAIKQRGE